MWESSHQGLVNAGNCYVAAVDKTSPPLFGGGEQISKTSQSLFGGEQISKSSQSLFGGEQIGKGLATEEEPMKMSFYGSSFTPSSGI